MVVEASEPAAEVFVPEEGFAPDWPQDVRERCAQLFSYDAEEIRGKNRLGSLSFDDAPEAVEGIKQIVRDIALEQWDQLPPSLTSQGQLQAQLTEVCTTLDQMIELSADSDTPGERASELRGRLAELFNWFRQEVSPLALNARWDRRAAESAGDGSGIADPVGLRTEYQDLRGRYEELKRLLDESEDAVSATRAEAGKSAGKELEAVFRQRAIDYVKSADKWLIALIVAVPVAAAIAVGTFELLRPDSGSKDAHDFAGLGLWVFVLGLLAFGIRICAQNFRINRHLATVARSKESSCSTFQRLVVAIADEDVRTAVTVTLAQSIFAVEETGMIDGSGDHVTLVERAVLPNIPKPS